MPHITFFPSSGPPQQLPHLGGSVVNPGEFGPPPVVGLNILPVAQVTIPRAACELLSGNAKIACEIAAGLFNGDTTTDCPAGFVRIGENCVPVVPTGDPTPGVDTPAERGPNGASGLTAPSKVCVETFKCPRFADGKTGILWMNALTGAVVCLPRATNGKGFGLIRKNKPRAKPPMSAADFRQLKRNKRLADKAKKLAMDSGFTCKKR